MCKRCLPLLEFIAWSTFWLFLLFAFFPYVAFVDIGTDLQPYALVMAVASLLIYPAKKLPNEVWLLCLPMLFGVFLAAGSGMGFSAIRGASSYAMPFFGAAATYLILAQRPNLVDRYVKVVPYVWLAVGLIQTLLARRFLHAVIPAMSTDAGRGVSGLATEPSFYGIFCLFLLVLNYLRDARDRWVQAALIFQILFLAKSGVTALFLVLLLGYYSVARLSLRQLAVSGAVLIATYYVAVTYASDHWRIVYLAVHLVKNPKLLILTDTSVNARVSHVLFSVAGFANNHFLPHGFGHFISYVKRALSVSYPHYPWLGALDRNMRIMSGYGSALFELGLVGMLYPLAITMAVLKYYRGDSRGGFTLALFLNTILFGAIQLSLPLLGVLVGYLSYYGNQRTRHLRYFRMSRRSRSLTLVAAPEAGNAMR